MSTYTSGTAVWSEEEEEVIQEALSRYPISDENRVEQCIKIAALLPKKCVRDVVAFLRDSQEKQEHTPQRQSTPVSLEESRIQRLLRENTNCLHEMQENLSNGRLQQNLDLIAKFRGNIDELNALLDSSLVKAPPLPVSINTKMIQTIQQNTVLAIPASSGVAFSHSPQLSSHSSQFSNSPFPLPGVLQSPSFSGASSHSGVSAKISPK